MNSSILQSLENYKSKLEKVWRYLDYEKVNLLANELLSVWSRSRNIFICVNGGSEANVNHIANDLIFGVNPEGKGLKVHSLWVNSSINLCLANDIGHENIFSHQLETLATKGDILITLSESCNSPNIVKTLNKVKNWDLEVLHCLDLRWKSTETCRYFNSF